jgi:hypothetical protein
MILNVNLNPKNSAWSTGAIRYSENAPHSVQWTGGYAAHFESFPGFGFYPFRRRVSALPPATNASRWGTIASIIKAVTKG